MSWSRRFSRPRRTQQNHWAIHDDSGWHVFIPELETQFTYEMRNDFEQTKYCGYWRCARSRTTAFNYKQGLERLGYFG
jgi:hypothetical protein